MDTLNSVEVVNDSTNKETKKRSTYVSKDHVSMVNFVSEIYKNLGHTDYHSNKAIAAVNGLSPDSIKQHLSSCQQYKLLEIKHGTGYKITDLFKRIFLPVNETEKRSAIIESLKAPDTYQQLFKEYEYHIVPPLNGIKNHFVRNLHLKEDIAEKTAQIFIDNLNDYELIDYRGVLTSAINLKPIENNKPQDLPENREEREEEKENIKVDDPKEPKIIDIVIPLKTTKTQAHLLIPEDYKEEDLERIARFVDALK